MSILEQLTEENSRLRLSTPLSRSGALASIFCPASLEFVTFLERGGLEERHPGPVSQRLEGVRSDPGLEATAAGLSAAGRRFRGPRVLYPPKLG